MSSHAFTIPAELTQGTGAWPDEGPIRFGSDEHKRLFCKTLLDTHNPYRPRVLDWPELSEDARTRITSLPIWDIAVQTENKASMNVATYAGMIGDPLLKKAVTLDGYEEKRHRHVLANMVEAYGIKLAPEPPVAPPRDPEWAFMVTGYSECIDSFFAFGLFKAAKDTGYFPAELVDTFEPVVHEEGRHILFFVNWISWHRRNMPLWRRPWFELKVLAVWIFLIYERIGIAKDVGNGQQDNNFTMNGAEQLGADINVGELIAICVAENDRRLGIFDPRLKQPRFVPFMARLALRFIGPKKQPA
jgi:hypothetical protein